MRAAKRRRERFLPFDWPFAAMFLGYPVWWLLGVGPFAVLCLAAVMALQLVRQRRILAPPAFGWWLLFLAWAVVGVAVLQVDAPGAVAGDNNARYLVWAYRLLWYLAATVVLLYVGSMRNRISTGRIVRVLGWMFVVVTLGGLAGTLLPFVSFPSLLEVVLPQRVAGNGFLLTKIHPTFAQVGDVLGYDFGRPSAPFPYANEWGLNFGVFLPFFVVSWFSRDAGWRRWVAPLVLLVAVVPVVYSLNRGLWVSLIVAAAFVAVRSAMTGRLTSLVGLLALGGVVATIVLLTPLTGTIQARLQQPNSNEGRTNLGLLGIESMVSRSPVVGFGTTRDVQGTFKSIAAGQTANCPLCSPPALGTQGRLWLVSFGSGLGGLVTYVGFLALQLLRHVRLKSPYATAALTTLVVNFVTLPIYDLSGTALLAAMCAAAVLWREQDRQRATSTATALPSLGEYLCPVRAHGSLIAATAVAGLLLGAGWQVVQGTPVQATVSIWLPTEPVPERQLGNPTTLDTEAQFVSSPLVEAAMRRAAGAAPGVGTDRLTVSASPNTRILHLTYVGDDPEAARKAVTAAADTLLDMRGETLEARRRALFERQGRRTTALGTALQTLDVAERNSTSIAPLIQRTRRDLLDRPWEDLTIARPNPRLPLTPGQVIRAPHVRAMTDQWVVALVSGLMLGLLVGLLAAYVRHGLTERLRRSLDVSARTGLPLLGRITSGEAGSTQTSLERRLIREAANSCVSADQSPAGCRFAARLDATLLAAHTSAPGGQNSAMRAVLVITHRTRAGEVVRLAKRLQRANVAVLGLVTLVPD